MKSIVFKPTMPSLAVLTRLATAALLLLALAACNSGGSGTKKARSIPLEPTNLVAKGVNKGIDISWNKARGATSYTVYYHTKSFDETTDSGVKSKPDITTDSTSITRLTDGTKYYLRVAATNAKRETNLSKQVSATTKLLSLQPKAASSISLAAVDLSWGIAAGGVTDYKIYYAKQSLDGLNGGYQNYASVGGKLETTKGISVTIGGLAADTTYYFVVAANYHGKEKSALEVSADSSYIAELAMGGEYGCVRLNTGSMKCWGRNDDGELGIGRTPNKRTTATSVSDNLKAAKQLSAGGAHSCAIALNNDLYCWGDNVYFQLGLKDNNLNRSIPEEVIQINLAEVSLVAAGRNSTCVLAGGNNYCWGLQRYGGLGNGVGSDDSIMDAQQIKDITPDVKQFALGSNSGCAIDASADLWCWGRNAYGQVGDDTTTDRTSPVKPLLQGNSTATMLAGKDSHYCAIDDDKKIQCWGLNSSGQLGIDSTADSKIPQYVLASRSKSVYLRDVSKITTGNEHSCALIANSKVPNSRVRCWGKSEFGRLGPGVTADRLVAGTDIGIDDAIDIAAGAAFTCVLLADKASVKCWGRNNYGQLGNDTTADSHTPVAVKEL